VTDPVTGPAGGGAGSDGVSGREREGQATRTALPDGVALVAHANPVRNLNPTTHVVLAIVLAVISQLFGLWSVGAVVLTSAVIAAVAGRLGAFLRAWAPTVLLLSVVIVALQTLFIEGPTVLFSWWILDGTAEGLERGVTFAARIMGVATPLVLAVQLADRRRFMLEMERRKVPPKAIYVVVAAMNLIPEMRKQLDAIMDAQRARGVETDANWFVRVRAFLPSLIPLILSSILSVEEKALALQSRGFTLTGSRTSLYAVVDTRTDRVLRAVLWGVLLLAVLGRIVLWVL
jgi:energy-coupling factor transport system permease protein